MLTKQLRKLKYLSIKLLRIKGRTHNISLGFTIGLIINFIPSFGVGPFLSTVGPKLFRGNCVAGFIGGIILIWAFPLFFYLNVIVGEALLPIKIDTKIDIILDGIEADFTKPEQVFTASLKIGKAFFLGMIVNILLVGTVIYTLTYYVFKKFRIDLLKFIYKKWPLAKAADSVPARKLTS